MAVKTIIICDKCKKEEVINGNSFYNSTFKEVELKLKNKYLGKYRFCPDCLIKLGINLDAQTSDEVKTSADILLEAIIQVVQENIQF